MSTNDSSSSAARSSHRWRFFRAGGFSQVRFETGADLANLGQLDQKLWAALSCPTRGVEFDQKTLDLLDTDKDGRIRAPEVIAAVQWACSLVKNPDELLKDRDALPIDAINESNPEGAKLISCAKHVLTNLGKKDATAISPDDTGDTVKVFAQTQFNGDGIVPADAASDDATKAVINDIITCCGAETDRSGKPGVSQATVDRFFAEAQGFSDWSTKGESEKSSIFPLGDATADAFVAYQAVQAKVDDFFARCRLAAFDERALAALNRQESEYLAVAAQDMSITAAEVAGFPLARISATALLPLKRGLNPAWTVAITNLAATVLKPLLGEKESLGEADWATVTARFGPYAAWSKAKPQTPLEKLGQARVREILKSKAKESINALLAKDKALEAEANSIASLDKLARLARDLKQLLVNFVSFEDFYSRKRKAIFQAGTLYLDGRSCDLCVPVADAGKHAALAGLAKTYLAYCDCTRPTGQKMTVAVAFTGGDSDFLMVGRNGIFYDRKGQDWDATITKVIDNPISIRQAFWAPYKKLVRLIEEQVAKRAAAAEAASDAKVGAAATAAATADKPAPAAKKVDVGTVAALGVAFGAIGTLLATTAGYFGGILKLPFWQVCLAFVAILLVISTPSMLIAWLKLRQRNLGPILDANGWAVNGRVKMNVPFGGTLTKVGTLPAGAQSSAAVRYPEPPAVLPRILFTIVAICFVISLLTHFGVIRFSEGSVKFGWPQKPATSEATSTTTTTATATATTTTSTNAPPK